MNKMQAERTACGQCVITIESIMPIILEYISAVERLKAARCADKLLTSAALANDMMWSVLDQHKQRHGPGDITDDFFATFEKGFGQWVPFFQESGQPTDISEGQLMQMFGHVNTHLPAHQSAPQEPRTPEQATHIIPAVTPPKLELRAFMDITREPEDLRTGMEQEEALVVVAMYGADALVRAVDRGLVALRLKAALLTWRTVQLLNALQDIREDWSKSGDQLLREMVGLWGIVHMGTAVASWRQHLPTSNTPQPA